MKTHLILTLALSIMTSSVFAQAVRNTTERIGNQRELAVSEAQLERDLQELADFKIHVNAFERAVDRADLPGARRHLALLTADMQREIQQSEAKIAGKQREVQQSKSEVASERRDLARGRRDRRRTQADRADDVRDQSRNRRDKRDDQRDLADDRDDRNEQVARLNRQRDIRNVFVSLNLSDESKLTKAKANLQLLNVFADTMEADIAETREEISEDKKESREDRRETRDDRRERREKG